MAASSHWFDSGIFSLARVSSVVARGGGLMARVGWDKDSHGASQIFVSCPSPMKTPRPCRIKSLPIRMSCQSCEHIAGGLTVKKEEEWQYFPRSTRARRLWGF